jgi:hypothetical protein
MMQDAHWGPLTQQQAAEKLAPYEVKYLPRLPAYRLCNVERYSINARMPLRTIDSATFFEKTGGIGGCRKFR